MTRALVAAACSALLGCAGQEQCNPSPVTSCPQTALRYPDVQPIIQRRCLGCHSGLTEQWPLTDYDHVASWFDIIPPELLACRMPPADAGMGMTDEERTTILTWLHCGFPE
ncbi:MAG TPA: hypothetical protein VMK66_16400 [Myxococcales bacterium]|nr:hypothetical protein [Myxococcales bacterium]